MDEDRTDRTLRSLFRRQKLEDERRVPPFALLLDSAKQTPRCAPRAVRSWLRLAGAAAVAVGLVLALDIIPPQTPQPAFEIEAWSALLRWTAPTDSLLEWSGAQGGGITIAAPTDLWFGAAQESIGQQPMEKETL